MYLMLLFFTIIWVRYFIVTNRSFNDNSVSLDAADNERGVEEMKVGGMRDGHFLFHIIYSQPSTVS